jgi:hypothetical protein
MKGYFCNYNKIKKNNSEYYTVFDIFEIPVDKSLVGSSQQVSIVKGKE